MAEYKRVNWAANERITLVDESAQDNLAFANLALSLKQFLAPTNGVVKGGGYELPGGLSMTLKPLAVVASGGPCILDADYPLTPFAPNGSGQDRIDLVSIGYAEAGSDAGQRLIITPGTGVDTETTINTRITSTPAVTVTQGTPDTPPAAPATPAGHVPLYEVLVRDGAAALIDSDITRVESSVVRPLKAIVSPDVGPNVGFPYISDPLEGVVTPQGGLTLIVGTLTGVNIGAHTADFFRLKIINADTLDVIQTAICPKPYSSPPLSAPTLTMFVMTPVFGPIAATNYALLFERNTTAGVIGGTFIESIVLAAITF